MLLNFQVKNFKKFKEKISFDLSKTRNYTFNETVTKNKLLNIALIYGSNGSGKSNLGFAIFDIIFHTTDNEKISEFYSNYLYGNGILDDTAEFTYTFKFGEDIFKYRYIKENLEVLQEEELFLNDNRIIYLNRKTSEISINIEEAKTLKIENILDTNLSLLKFFFNNAILDKNSSLLELWNFLNSMLWFRSVRKDNFMGYKLETKEITDSILDLNKIKKDNNLSPEEKENKLKINLQNFEDFLKDAGILLQLKTREAEGKRFIEADVDGRLLPFYEIISSGTMALTTFYIWYKNLDNVKFLFIDEFDSFYHFKLSKLIIKKLKEKINTQTILTTHATNLMDNELLRPDCYFILKNNKIKSLPELTEKELREAHNIEKLFKSGTFDE